MTWRYKAYSQHLYIVLLLLSCIVKTLFGFTLGGQTLTYKNYNDKHPTAANNCSFECQSSSLQKSCTGISPVDDCIS